MRAFACSFLASLLGGCGCPSFEETRVVEDPDAPGGIDEIRAALADFASWTSRDGVCVDEITTAKLDDASGGTTPSGSRIRIDTADGSVREITLHELCHAWDIAEGMPGQARDDLFPPSAVPVSPPYKTDARRAEESFAIRCERGPTEIALATLAADLCDTERPDEADVWLREHVFDAWADPSAWSTATAPIVEMSRVALPGATVEEAHLSPTPAGDALAMIRLLHDESWNVTGGGVMLLDSSTGVVTGDLPFPADLGGWPGLLRTDGVPILWTTEGDRARAWRLDADAPIELPFPSLPHLYALGGYAWGDTAWVHAILYDGSEESFTLDLSSGATGDLPLPEGISATGLRLRGRKDRLWVDDGAVVAEWSFTAGEWGPLVAVPAWEHYFFGPLDDGRLVFGLYLREAGTIVPAVMDPADGTWVFPEGDCGAVGIDPLNPWAFASGDALYRVEAGSETAEGLQLDLVRVAM